MDRKNFLKNLTGGFLGAAAAGPAMAANQPATANNLRSIRQVIPGKREQVAPGFFIRRPLPHRQLRNLDPFLLLDHMGPKEIGPDEGAYVPPHPHRGFEPVTFIFEGSAEHKDSMGNHGRLTSGGVQWMTSGKGIIHSERIDREQPEGKGMMHGVQLWVNLPKAHKMTQPGYQNMSAEEIPVVKKTGAKVRVIAGEIFGKKGPAKTFTAINAFHVVLDPGATVNLPIPATHNVLSYTLEGNGRSGDKTLNESYLAEYAVDGQGIELTSTETGREMSFLVLSGEPIREPVVSYGPFVMNSMNEIQSAYQDYQQGKMGKIDF